MESITDACACLASLTHEQVASFVKKGYSVWKGAARQFSVVYIPSGFSMACAAPDSPTSWGLTKHFMPKPAQFALVAAPAQRVGLRLPPGDNNTDVAEVHLM